MLNTFAKKDINTKLINFYKNFLTNDYTIQNLFDSHSDRSQIFSISDLNCHLDFSKNWVDQISLDQLCRLADHCKLDEYINKLFNPSVSASKINSTEDKNVWHTALRAIESNNLDNSEIHQPIQHIQQKISNLVNSIHSSKLLGFSSKPIKTIVNIGIGGSDLGPRMVYQALKAYHNKNITCYFVANIDPAEISYILEKCSPETTLFIISSKSFTTPETLANAKTAYEWLTENSAGKNIQNQYIAITNQPDKAIAFGVHPDQIFPIWDWVGGRYSLWSAIGLIIALGTSYKTYRELLAGAFALDQHFRKNEWKKNIPVVLGLLGIGYINYANCQSHAILPYSSDLTYFPSYVQQLDMESNGKSINRDNNYINYKTAPVIWGAAGTNGQHTFYQLLHQGQHIVPCDFIVPITSSYHPASQQQELVANALAQSKTLMEGYQPGDLPVYRHLLGNKPSNTLLFSKLSPYNLGILIAMYEHKIFTQGVIWNINSFDQWGVERGKTIADVILPYLSYNSNYKNHDKLSSNLDLDKSTLNLINKYQELREL
ncbi:MAG: glucose-6-phosphate isomerase [Gammaproteobacteria bacterium]|nr:glucose-6-phosphate isomerase [Gammaproteobacteria bacterium]